MASRDKYDVMNLISVWLAVPENKAKAEASWTGQEVTDGDFQKVTVAEVKVTEAEAKEVFGLLDVLSMGSISKEELFGALSPPEPVPPAAVAASAPAPASHDLAALEKKAREAAEGLDKELDALSSKVEKGQKDDKEEAAKTGGAIADAAGAGAENQARAGEGGKKESADAATSSSQQHGAASGPSEKKSEGSSSSAAGVGVGVGVSAAGAAVEVAGKDEGRSGQGGAGSTSGAAGGESAPVVQVVKSLDAIRAALVGKGEGLLQALKALDSNNDGKISSREFCRAVVKMPGVELMQADAALLYASLVTVAKDGGEGTLTIAEVEAVLVDPDTAAKLPDEIKTEPVKQPAPAAAPPPGGGGESGGGSAGGVDAALSSEGVSHGRSIQAIRNMLKQRGAAVLAQLRDADSGKAGDSLTLGEFRGALQQLGSEINSQQAKVVFESLLAPGCSTLHYRDFFASIVDSSALSPRELSTMLEHGSRACKIFAAQAVYDHVGGSGIKKVKKQTQLGGDSGIVKGLCGMLGSLGWLRGSLYSLLALAELAYDHVANSRVIVDAEGALTDLILLVNSDACVDGFKLARAASRVICNCYMASDDAGARQGRGKGKNLAAGTEKAGDGGKGGAAKLVKKDAGGGLGVSKVSYVMGVIDSADSTVVQRALAALSSPLNVKPAIAHTSSSAPRRSEAAAPSPSQPPRSPQRALGSKPQLPLSRAPLREIGFGNGSSILPYSAPPARSNRVQAARPAGGAATSGIGLGGGDGACGGAWHEVKLVGKVDVLATGVGGVKGGAGRYGRKKGGGGSMMSGMTVPAGRHTCKLCNERRRTVQSGERQAKTLVSADVARYTSLFRC